MAFPTTSVLEHFTGTNGTTPPNSSWTNGGQIGNAGLQIQSNTCAKVSGNGCGWWNPSTFLEAEAFATLTTVSNNTNNSGGVFVRGNSMGTASAKCYLAIRETNTAVALYRVASGTVFTFLARATYTMVANDVIGISASGSGATVSLVLYINGVSKVTFSDTNAARITTAGNIGIYEENVAARWDEFGGGTIVTAQDATVAAVAMSANASMPASVPGVAVQLAGMVANASMPVDVPEVRVIAAPPTATASMSAPVPEVRVFPVALAANASMPAAVPTVKVLPGAFAANASMTAPSLRLDVLVAPPAMSARAGTDLPYVTKMLSYGPAVFWYANEYAGTTLEDHSGNARAGTINGSAVTYRAEWLTPSIQSLGFAPSAGTPILASRAYADTTNAFSAVVWGSIPNVGAASGEVELLAHDDSDSFGWWIWYSPGSLPTVIQFQMVDHNGVNHTLTYDFLARAALEDPHMYGITFDGTNMTLYVDGANVATRTTTWDAASANANSLLVGRTSGGQQCKVGMAAFVRNVVLSDTDMANLYTEGTKALSLVNQDTPEVRMLPGAFTANATMTAPAGSFNNVVIFPPAMAATASMPTPSPSASNQPTDPSALSRGEFLLRRRRRRVVQ